jgi:subtilase family serine protease
VKRKRSLIAVFLTVAAFALAATSAAAVGGKSAAAHGKSADVAHGNGKGGGATTDTSSAPTTSTATTVAAAPAAGGTSTPSHGAGAGTSATQLQPSGNGNGGSGGNAGGNGNGNGQSSDYTIASNTPGFVKKAQDLGAADPAQVIDVQVWLQLHNQAHLDKLVESQRTRGSSQYHKWIDQATVGATYAPTDQEVKSVSNFLSAHGLTVGDVAENNMYVNASGPISAVDKAFHVDIHTFRFDGQTYYSNTSDPHVNDSSGAHVAAIGGLDDYGYQPNVAFPTFNGEQPSFTPLAAHSNGLVFSAQCFRAPETDSFASADGTRTATYTGNRYGQDITSPAPNAAPCGYQPSEIHTAYDLSPLYDRGLTGAGQTVVITDAFGSPTIQQDAQVFSEAMGLPPVDLTVYRAPGVFHNRSPRLGAAGWRAEVTLDVEWVHAIAPGAKIALVVGPTDTGSLDEAINWAVVHHLGNVISNSWGTFEGLGNPARFDRTNRILEVAAAEGIDVNFGSGDFGDDADVVGFRTVDFPSSSPFATSVGGTSLALDGSNGIDWQTAWGTNITRIAKGAGFNADGTPKSDPATAQLPPLPAGGTAGAFDFGAGGGTSLFYPKPDFQSSLPGTMRQTPDIGWLADPFTGVEIIQTVGGQLGIEVIGGTSLSAPMFSGLMAIATQKAGHGLGQAAPLVYGLPAGAVDDVTQATVGTNVTGTVTNPAETFSADLLAGVTGDRASRSSGAPYISAIYNSPFSTNWFTLTFGTDTTLAAAPGWDEVTGVGTPVGEAFVDALVP